jgi:hypothetical protein
MKTLSTVCKYAFFSFSIIAIALQTKEIMLRKVDCRYCRAVISLVAAPNDYNAAISIAEIDGRTATVFLFPYYVAPYSIQIYGIESQTSIRIETISCTPELAVNVFADTHKVFSRYGRGAILAGLMLDVDAISSRERIECKVRLNKDTKGRIVVSRIDEN